MYYINKLYELGQLSFKTTNPSIIDELLEYYIYDNNLSIDINKYNCSIRRMKVYRMRYVKSLVVRLCMIIYITLIVFNI